MADEETISVYNEKTAEYAAVLQSEKPAAELVRFMNVLPPQAYVLDLGCGLADASAHMREGNFKVDPVDASPGMVEAANKAYAINARVSRFEDLAGAAIYDGVWANFSLLHALAADFPKHLQAIHTILKPGGHFNIAMKTRKSPDKDDGRDHLGRYYSYYKEAELKQHLDRAGFQQLGESKGEDVGLAGDIDPWISILNRKTQD